MTASAKTEAKLKTFDAFAPLADALEAIPNLDVPDVARDFAKRMTGLGERFATDGRDAVEKATATIENTAVSSVRELGRVSRAVQTALYQDAAALLAGLRHLSTAASPTDALQIQSDYLRSRANATAERVKAVADYVGRAASKLEGSAS
ncbi:MAG: phasin family protein [Hyphomicrobiales bacterium]|nr:phasin family protein [Hyphomicrobiales bacterium]MBV8440985.1 phasin family protein [Hyphomicrobiales bacterium]